MRGVELQYMLNQHGRERFDLCFTLVVEVRPVVKFVDQGYDCQLVKSFPNNLLFGINCGIGQDDGYVC